MVAPAALGLFAVVLVIVIAASVGGGSDSGGSDGRDSNSAQRTGGAEPATERPASDAAAGRRVYRVRSGDTLASIAERTQVPLARLLELNPTIDPQGLVTGQRIRLRE